jgi:hypothetical protein
MNRNKGPSDKDVAEAIAILKRKLESPEMYAAVEAALLPAPVDLTAEEFELLDWQGKSNTIAALKNQIGGMIAPGTLRAKWEVMKQLPGSRLFMFVYGVDPAELGGSYVADKIGMIKDAETVADVLTELDHARQFHFLTNIRSAL